MLRRLSFAFFATLLTLPAVAPVAATEAPSLVRDKTKAYDPAANAEAAVDEAVASAKASNRKAILAFGANWCHDSAVLSDLLASDRLKPMIAAHYELVFIDVGHPQDGKGRNLDLAARFGIKDLKSTPALLIISPVGTPLNLGEAVGWRNAASRKPDDVYAYFERYGEVK